MEEVLQGELLCDLHLVGALHPAAPGTHSGGSADWTARCLLVPPVS